MKNISIVIAIAISVAGCGTIKPITAAAVHEQTIGAVQITFDDTGNWIKLVSTGVAPTHDKSAQAASEATKIAAMRAKQNIVEFLNNDIRSDKTVEIVTKSSRKSSTGSDKSSREGSGIEWSDAIGGNKTNTEKDEGELKIMTTVIERIRDNSSSILRGVQTTKQSVAPDHAWVEVTVSKQSIAASQSLHNVMSGNTK